MTKRVTRGAAAIVAVCLGSAMLTASPAQADFSTIRVAGADRYGTAVEISKMNNNLPVGNNGVVFIVSGTNFPDALAAGPAAGTPGATILLTMRDEIPQVTAAELTRLTPADIVVIGGPAAVSDEVFRQLDAYASGSVTRLAGSDRYDTAVEVTKKYFAPKETAFELYITSGEDFADALTAGAAARTGGFQSGALLLVQPNELPAVVAAEADRLNPGAIIVVGGTAAVSDAVLDALKQYGPTRRIAGRDRFDTATNVAIERFPQDRIGTMRIATGRDFPDALAAVAAKSGYTGPILLTERDCLPGRAVNLLNRWNPERIQILGGTEVVSDAVISRTRC